MPSKLAFDVCRELWRIENSPNFSISTVIAIIKGVRAIFKKNREHYKLLIRECGGVKRYEYELSILYIENRFVANESRTLISELREWKDSAAKDFMYEVGLNIYCASDEQIFDHLKYNGCCSLTNFQMNEISMVADDVMKQFYELLKTL